MKNTEKHEKETNREYALRVIKDNIVNLELAPGSMISEQDIANELNLSRTPVHEAMQELSSTKIIEIAFVEFMIPAIIAWAMAKSFKTKSI